MTESDRLKAEETIHTKPLKEIIFRLEIARNFSQNKKDIRAYQTAISALDGIVQRRKTTS